MTSLTKKRLIIILFGLTGAVLGGLGFFYLSHRLSSVPVTVENIKVDSGAALKLAALKQVSKKNGITEWELAASSATLLKAENKAVLEDVTVVFHTREKTQIHLSSDQGTLNTQTHNLVFKDNVVVKYEGYTLKSDKLHYTKKEHIIHTDSRVTMTDGASVIQADTMETRLNQNRIILKGHVKGTFSETFNLP